MNKHYVLETGQPVDVLPHVTIKNKKNSKATDSYTLRQSLFYSFFNSNFIILRSLYGSTASKIYAV